MRILGQEEQKKRGCYYCLDRTVTKEWDKNRRACPFDKCPYKVLDKYKSYDDFMASEDSQIPVSELFEVI